MKTLKITLLILMLTVPGWAQTGLFEILTGKYAEKDGFSASMISDDMFDLYLKKRNIEENSPVYEALKNLDHILVVSQSAFFSKPIIHPDSMMQDPDVAEIHQEILEHYKKNNYSLFKTEKQMGEDVKVFLKKDKDKIVSLALVTNTKKATNLVELQGDIDLATVSQLNQALNLRGLESLYKINGPDNPAFYRYAPDVHFPEEWIREMTDKQREFIEKQRHLTKEQRQKIEIQVREMAEKHKAMAEKYREMAQKYQRQPVFLGSPGDSTTYYLNGKIIDAAEIKKIPQDDIESIEVKKDKNQKERTTVKIMTKK